MSIFLLEAKRRDREIAPTG